MAEEPEKKAGHITFSRNLLKATMRNSVQGDTLQKDLKFIQGQRKKLAHSWEQRKESFMKRKFSKLPVLRTSRGESERDGLSDESSRMNNERLSRVDNYKTPMDHRGSMSSQLFISTSHQDNKESLNAPLRNRKAHSTNVPKLTVKDLSRILCPGKTYQSVALNDSRETQNQTSSPITSNKLQRRFQKEPTIRSDSSSPVCYPPTQIKQGYYRTFSLHPNDKDPTRDGKETPGISYHPNAQTRYIIHNKASDVTSGYQQNEDTASRPLQQEENRNISIRRHFSYPQSREPESQSQQARQLMTVKGVLFPNI